MDRALIERMVGAAVLVLVLVMLAPALLDGDRIGGDADNSGEQDGRGLRTEVIILNEPLNANLVADPEPDPVEFPAPLEQETVAAAVKPVPVEKVATPAPTPTPKPEPKPKPKPKPKPAPVAKVAPPPVVKQSVAAAKPAVKPAPVTKVAVSAPSRPPPSGQSVPLRSPPPAGFGVQLGSFSSRDNAERYALAVRKEGFEVFLTRAVGKTGAVYRVYAGPRTTRAAAEKLSGVLANSGRSVMVVDLNAQGGK
jgi:cell division septation protein DedD